MAHDNTNKFYNPLKRYQTYAYYHILIACDSTQTAREIEKAGNITELQRARQQSGDTADSKYAARNAANGGKFVVLIDGLTDSDFNVDSVEWSTMIAPTEAEQHSMLNIGGKLQIHEPYGVAFMERMVNLGSSLGTDMTGILFMLKTVFVGYRDGEPPPYNVTMLPQYRPFLFTMTNITSVINENGSQYEMTVFGASNGFAKLPHVSNMGKGFSVTLNTSDTLTVSLQKAFKEINRLYLTQAELMDIVLTQGPELEQTFAEGGNFRRVKYSIKSVDYDTPDYSAGTNENTLTEGEKGTVTINMGEGATIDDIVDKIMRSSKEVMDDAAGKPGERYIFKINSMLESTPAEMEIVYQVNKYKSATTPYLAVQNKIPSDIPADEIREYDYIFTGQNTDILDLDIKMNMGMSFFHTASSSTHPISQNAILGGTEQTNVAGACDGGTNTADGKTRPRTPLFLGDKVTDSTIRNCKAPVSTATYQSMLERHAFLESTAVTMKIAGDPGIMAEMLITEENTAADDVGQNKRRSFLATPIIFKINIRYPIDGKLKPFWYQGLYTLQKVDNIFSDGSFTQVLTLYSLPTVTDSSSAADAEQHVLRETDTNSVGSGADQTDITVSGQIDDITNGLIKEIM